MAQTNTGRAYEHIRAKLLDGTWQPGDRLRYGPVGKEIGVSATPVREAIARLAAEGLVDLIPDLGAVVRQITRLEAIELYQMREALEPRAAAWAASKLRDRDLHDLQSFVNEMLDCGRQLSESQQEVMPRDLWQQYEASEMGFHMTIIQVAGNGTLVRVIRSFHILALTLGADPTYHSLSMVVQAYRDHRRVLRALKRRDSTAAYQAMERHIQSALVSALEAYDQQEHSERLQADDWGRKVSRIDPPSNGKHRVNSKQLGSVPSSREGE